MNTCCAEKMIEMQKIVQVGKWLKLLVSASPFILIAPNLDPSMDLSAGREFIIEEICKLSADAARSRLMKKVKLPDFADACLAANCVTVNSLAQAARGHANRHLMKPEGFLWEKMAESYLTAVQNQQCTSPSSWMPWSW